MYQIDSVLHHNTIGTYQTLGKIPGRSFTRLRNYFTITIQIITLCIFAHDYQLAVPDFIDRKFDQ